MRLWNMRTKTCVLVATGDGGHTNEVLSVVRPFHMAHSHKSYLSGFPHATVAVQDFNPIDGNNFVSSGMDDTVKIWWLKGLAASCSQPPPSLLAYIEIA